MRKIKPFLAIVALLIILVQTAKAQTPVSGGIYTNATWTILESPYIVTANVVVFPGVTLTIEPGVTVKFENNTRLEIRQGRIIAIGNINDSIIFTSHVMPPVDGWNIKLNNDSSSTFKYCIFSFSSAAGAISRQTSNINCNLEIKNSSFKNDPVALNTDATQQSYTLIDSCIFKNNTQGAAVNAYVTVDHSNFSNNKLGITISYGTLQNSIIDSNGLTDTTGGVGVYAGMGTLVNNCIIINNDIGIKASTGSSLATFTKNDIENNNYGIILLSIANIHCNKICNNILFDLSYIVTSGNLNADNNYWCTNDLNEISARIYDGYDNVLFGLVNFNPIDTTQCYLSSGIKDNNTDNSLFEVFPNPAFNYINLILPENNFGKIIKVYNLMGQLELISETENVRPEIDISGLNKGVYIIEIISNDKIIRSKFIKQ